MRIALQCLLLDKPKSLRVSTFYSATQQVGPNINPWVLNSDPSYSPEGGIDLDSLGKKDEPSPPIKRGGSDELLDRFRNALVEGLDDILNSLK